MLASSGTDCTTHTILPTFSLISPACPFYSSLVSAFTSVTPPLSIYLFPLLISRAILLPRPTKERRVPRKWRQNKQERRRPCLVWPAAPDSICSFPLSLWHIGLRLIKHASEGQREREDEEEQSPHWQRVIGEGEAKVRVMQMQKERQIRSRWWSAREGRRGESGEGKRWEDIAGKVEGWPVSEPERRRVVEWEGLIVSGAEDEDLIKEKWNENKKQKNNNTEGELEGDPQIHHIMNAESSAYMQTCMSLSPTVPWPRHNRYVIQFCLTAGITHTHTVCTCKELHHQHTVFPQSWPAIRSLHSNWQGRLWADRWLFMWSCSTLETC